MEEVNIHLIANLVNAEWALRSVSLSEKKRMLQREMTGERQ